MRRSTTLNSMSWYAFDILLNRGAYFFITIYIAKIIGPTEFGLASILGVIYYLGISISDSGMSNSLMRTKVCDDSDYGTVLITNLIFGFVVYIFLIAVSPLISSFYNVFKLRLLLPVYGLGIILSSCKSVYIAHMMKNFRYKRMFLLNFPGNLISIILAIALSMAGYGIWSIVWLFLANQIISLILFIIFAGWKTKININKQKFSYHFNFGYKLSISSFFNTVFENIYQLIIGKYYSIRMTGIYDRAFTLGNYPISILSTVISKVTLPLFADHLNDKEIFKNKFMEAIKLVSFAASFFTFLILIVVPFSIENYMGSQWDESIIIFKILCFGLLLYPIHSLNLNILNVYGRSDIFLMLEVIKKFVQIVLIAICYQYGINGLAISFVALSFVSLVINLYYTNYFIGYRIINQLLDIVPNIIVGGISLILSSLILMVFETTLFVLIIKVLVFTTFYCALSFVGNKASVVYIYNLIKSKLKNIN